MTPLVTKKQAEPESAKTKNLRGAVSGRGSVMSKDTSKTSVSPLKKRLNDSKGNLKNANGNAGEERDEDDSRNKKSMENDSSP